MKKIYNFMKEVVFILLIQIVLFYIFDSETVNDFFTIVFFLSIIRLGMLIIITINEGQVFLPQLNAEATYYEHMGKSVNETRNTKGANKLKIYLYSKARYIGLIVYLIINTIFMIITI